MKPHLEALLMSPMQDYLTLGEVRDQAPAQIPASEAYLTAGDAEPDPVSLVDTVQTMTPERRTMLEGVDYFLYATQVRKAMGDRATPENIVSALRFILKPSNPDSWRESARKGYKSHLSCIDKAHQRMAALGIPRNR